VASGALLSAVACVPWGSVARIALEVLAVDRRLTPSGSFTQIGKGSAGTAGGVTVGADLGIGRDDGHDVGDGCGSIVAEVDG
jgi:hypothetical protein